MRRVWERTSSRSWLPRAHEPHSRFRSCSTATVMAVNSRIRQPARRSPRQRARGRGPAAPSRHGRPGAGRGAWVPDPGRSLRRPACRPRRADRAGASSVHTQHGAVERPGHPPEVPRLVGRVVAVAAHPLVGRAAEFRRRGATRPTARRRAATRSTLSRKMRSLSLEVVLAARLRHQLHHASRASDESACRVRCACARSRSHAATYAPRCACGSACLEPPVEHAAVLGAVAARAGLGLAADRVAGRAPPARADVAGAAGHARDELRAGRRLLAGQHAEQQRCCGWCTVSWQDVHVASSSTPSPSVTRARGVAVAAHELDGGAHGADAVRVALVARTCT
jgi:hypothetical protein